MKKRTNEMKNQEDLGLIRHLALDILLRNNWSVQRLVQELGVRGAFNPASSQSPKPTSSNRTSASEDHDGR